MCQAMMEYDRGNHDRAFELLYPLRYKILGIGGSDAQVRSPLIGPKPNTCVRWVLMYSMRFVSPAVPSGVTAYTPFAAVGC